MKRIIFYVFVLASSVFAYETPNPYPRQIIGRELVANWTFDKPSDTNGWRSRVDTELSYTNGILKIEIMRGDPAFYLPDIRMEGRCPQRPNSCAKNKVAGDGDPPANQIAKGPFLLEARIKSAASGEGQFFWTTTISSNQNSEKSETVPIFHDGNWHDYAVELPVNGTMMQLRFDPAFWNGKMEIDNLKLTRLIYHPVEILKVKTGENFVEAIVTNHSEKSINFYFEGKKINLEKGKTKIIKKQIIKSKPFENVIFNLSFPEKIAGDGDAPANQKSGGTLSSTSLTRVVRVFNPKAKTDWKILKNGNTKLEVAPDGSGAKIYSKDNFAGIISPLAKSKSSLKIDDVSKTKIKFSGEGIESLTLELKNNEIYYKLEGRCPQRPNSYTKNMVAGDGDPPEVNGPVVRAFGEMEQGLLAGVEYLGKSEKSSTKLDLVTTDYLRYAPDKMWITMPLMAFVTPKTSLALNWENMDLQPSFATPNFYDGTDDHRMGLQGTGKNIEVTILVSEGWNNGNNLSKIIEWYVKKCGIPSLPAEPRTENEQWELCLKAINGILYNSNGWGHAVDEKLFPRHHYSGMASLIWFMTGKLPEDKIMKKVSFGGGSHQSLFFTGRAQEWIDFVNRGIIPVYEKVELDGSVLYDGELSKGHFENTASGLCALNACRLLDFVKETGDERALTTGVKILNYMMRFRTPRGAQVWEIPMHTA